MSGVDLKHYIDEDSKQSEWYVSGVRISKTGAMRRLWDGTDSQAVLVRSFTNFGKISRGRRAISHIIYI